MPCTGRLAPRRFCVPGEFGAELVAPTTDRFVRDHDTTLKQQLLDVAQAQAESEIPADRAADDDGGEAMAVIKGISLLHHLILPPPVHQPDTAAERANVNVSAISYHFKSKENLFEEMFRRRVVPLNEERLRLLDECSLGRGAPNIEEVVSCFIAPPMQLEFSGGGFSAHVVMQFLGRVFAMPGESGFLEKYYEPVRGRFITTLMSCLPELSVEEVLWRYNLMVGALIYAMGSTARMTRSPLALAGRRVRGNLSVEQAIDMVINFVVHGMKGRPTLAAGRSKKRS